MKQYLFVYGTLANGMAPAKIAAVVKKLKYVGRGFVRGRLYDLGKYPGAVLDHEDTSKIFGKIYEIPIDLQVLRKIDEYEDFDPQNPSGSLFIRKSAPIYRTKQKKIVGWVYEYNGDVSSSAIIKSGDYLRIAA